MKEVKNKIFSLVKQSNIYILAILISGVIIAGILYSVYLGNNLRYPDEWDYYKIAQNIATISHFSLDGKTSTAFRAPGYPFTLAFFLDFGAEIVHLRILNFIILGLSLYLLHEIVNRESTRLSATISIILVMSMPVLFYTAGALYPQTLVSFLILLLIFLLNRDHLSKTIYLLAGVIFGYLILTVPMLIFVLFIFAFWHWYSQKTLKPFTITVATSILLIGAWSARNYMVFNSFVFISSNSGLNLLLGNSENTTSNAGVNVDISKYTNFADKAHFDEIEQDSYYRKEAIEFILGHKTESIKMYWLKFLNYFNYRNELWTKSESSSLRDIIMLVTYGPLLTIFVIRLLWIRKFKPTKLEVLLIGLYFSSAMFHAIFFTRIRFRLPFDFLLIAIVALFIQNILSHTGLCHPQYFEITEK